MEELIAGGSFLIALIGLVWQIRSGNRKIIEQINTSNVIIEVRNTSTEKKGGNLSANIQAETVHIYQGGVS